MYRNLPSLKSLLALEAVVRLGGVTPAANELCISHSAISQSIRHLEAKLATPLFVRDGRKLRATANAEHLTRKLHTGLQDLANACEEFQARGKPNEVALKMVGTLALRWFIPLLPRLRETLPNLKVNLVTETLSSFDNMPANVDAAVGYGRGEEFGAQFFYQLRPSELVLVTLAANEGAQEDIVGSNPCIRVTNALRSQDWEKWCEVNAQQPPEPAQCLSMPNSAQALEAVSAGAGVLVTQRLYVEQLVKLNHLRIAGQALIDEDEGYYFYCLPQKREQPSVRALESWLRNLSQL